MANKDKRSGLKRRWRECLPKAIAHHGGTAALADHLCTHGIGIDLARKAAAGNACPPESAVDEAERYVSHGRFSGRLEDGWSHDIGHLLDLREFRSKL